MVPVTTRHFFHLSPHLGCLNNLPPREPSYTAITEAPNRETSSNALFIFVQIFNLMSSSRDCILGFQKHGSDHQRDQDQGPKYWESVGSVHRDRPSQLRMPLTNTLVLLFDVLTTHPLATYRSIDQPITRQYVGILWSTDARWTLGSVQFIDKL
jgi:hypothetical protein